MSSEIRLPLVGDESFGSTTAAGSALPKPAPDSPWTLRFAIATSDPAGLEAIRHARRSMLREEWTLGREPGEPSLETAMFSAEEISWTVPLAQRSRCIERLAELESRASRALFELSGR
ncbi:MAG TPA: hypothetical protein VIA45_07905 [Thermoanaerobaculia bacterium]|jgi:hypothetical protein